MKAIAKLLLIVGIVLLIGGIFGFITIEGARRPGDDDVDVLRYLSSHIRGSINGSSQGAAFATLTMNCVNNRLLYTLFGLVLIIAGSVSNKKTQTHITSRRGTLKFLMDRRVFYFTCIGAVSSLLSFVLEGLYLQLYQYAPIAYIVAAIFWFGYGLFAKSNNVIRYSSIAASISSLLLALNMNIYIVYYIANIVFISVFILKGNIGTKIFASLFLIAILIELYLVMGNVQDIQTICTFFTVKNTLRGLFFIRLAIYRLFLIRSPYVASQEE